MELSLVKTIILFALIGLSGFIDSIAGGGGLVSLPAYFIVGFPPHMATGTNKLSAFMGACVATFNYARAGFIPLKIAAFSIIAAFAGASAGAKISLMVSDLWFKVILLFVLPAVAVYVFKDKHLDEKREPYSYVKTVLLCMPISFFVGMYDGFYGPGTGMFLILLYTSVAHLPLEIANGVSKAVNLTSNVASLIVFLMNGTTIIKYGLIAGCASMICSYIGSSLFKRDGSRIVRPVMLLVLFIFSAKIILELLGLA